MSDTPIKLLVMDLDGTLLPHGGVISERTIAAIRAARELGVITTISSGRNIPSFIEYARTAGVNGPLIGMQGGDRAGATGSGREWKWRTASTRPVYLSARRSCS